MPTLAERITEALAKAQEITPTKSKAGLARYCGVKPPSVIDWFSGRTRTLEYGNAVKAAEYLGVSPGWLCGYERHFAPYPEGLQKAAESDLIGLAECKISLSPAGKVMVKALPNSEDLYIRRSWFESRHLCKDDVKRFRILGDAATPFVCDEDWVLVDCADTKIVSGRIYAFLVQGMLRVGVLYRMLNGDILVRWHNPILPSETVPAAEVPNFRLIGRVLARGGSVACE